MGDEVHCAFAALSDQLLSSRAACCVNASQRRKVLGNTSHTHTHNSACVCVRVSVTTATRQESIENTVRSRLTALDAALPHTHTHTHTHAHSPTEKAQRRKTNVPHVAATRELSKPAVS